MTLALAETEFWPSSPAVMLSPKERNEVVASLGGVRIVTTKEHMAGRCRASVTVHVTVFGPTAKADPDGGVQAVMFGACPCATVGAAKVTTVAPPSGDCAVCAAGHVMTGGSVGTGVGVVGPPQAARTIAFTTRPAGASANRLTNSH